MKAKQRIVCIANCIISPELTEKLANSFDKEIAKIKRYNDKGYEKFERFNKDRYKRR